jgi:hypothetical protein
MADWAAIASGATALGTLALAGATYGSVRSANRAARVAEQSLLLGLRPVLVTSHDQDPSIDVGWGDEFRAILPGGRAVVAHENGVLYLAIALRNVGSGIAMLRSWTAAAGGAKGDEPIAPVDEFQPMQRDLYVAAGDAGYWHSAIRDRSDPRLPDLRAALGRREMITVELLYLDHEGGQPTVTRFGVRPDESDGAWHPSPVRHFRL